MKRRIANVRARHPVAFGLGLGVFLAASAAVAAFLVYQGVNGSTTGNFAGSSTVAAITITGGTASGTLSPNSSITMTGFTESNQDPNQAETINSLTPTFTDTSQPSCTSHLSATVDPTFIGHRILASASYTPTGPVTITADATTPSVCASSTYTLNWAGTTTAG